MYTIYHQGRILYDPRFQEYAVGNPTLRLEANKFGTLEFSIYPNHPEYGTLEKLTSIIDVYKDGVLYFRCRPSYSKLTFKNAITYQCEDLLARLADFLVRPFVFTGTITEFVDFVLAAYNSRVGDSAKILRGTIGVTDNNDYVRYSSESYISAWEALQSRLVETHGGYFIPRYNSNGTITLDYLSDADLPTSLQNIEFGANLTDLFVDTNSDETFSVLVPLGADTETYDENGDPITKPLTIESVNDGLDYIENDTAIALYGRRETVQKWDNVTLPENLLTKGRAWLDTNGVKFNESVQLSAVDLHNVSADIETFQWLSWVPVKSTLHNISTQYIALALTIPLGNPSSSRLQLGGTQRTLTDRIVNGVGAATQEAIDSQYNSLRDSSQLNFEEIRNTITQQYNTIEKLIGSTATSILSEVLNTYVAQSEFVKYQSLVGTQFEQTQSAITLSAEETRSYVDSSTAETRQYVNGIKTYMRFSTAGLEIGAEGSPFMTKITNERISFLQDNQEIAYISGQKLYITKAHVTQALYMGVNATENNVFVWEITDTGLGLKWQGQIVQATGGGE